MKEPDPLTARQVVLMVVLITFYTAYGAYLFIKHHTWCQVFGWKAEPFGPEMVCTRCNWFWLASQGAGADRPDWP